MHLTTYTDYSIRVLMLLKLKYNQRVTVPEVSEYFGVSKNHIVKVANNLAKLGLIKTTRGKGGGMVLAPEAGTAPLGNLIKELEPNKNLITCVNKQGQDCAIMCACKLMPKLNTALDNFYEELNQYTLSDIVLTKQPNQSILTIQG